MPAPQAIVLFDGVCHLCNGSVDFIFRNDPEEHFHYAHLQSPFGERLLKEYQLTIEDYDSVLLLENGQLNSHSKAALQILRRLRFPWNLFGLLMIVPHFGRDLIYNWIARNRYAWFGRHDLCVIPPAGLRERFVADGLTND
jgi:predicted DCC family thiol-disulfide oxidoreductase YuxK